MDTHTDMVMPRVPPKIFSMPQNVSIVGAFRLLEPHQKDVMKIVLPRSKSMNKYVGRELIGEIDPSDPLSWPMSILAVFEQDPILGANAISTPLFRDTRGLVRKVDSNFPRGLASKPIHQDWALKILLKLIVANP